MVIGVDEPLQQLEPPWGLGPPSGLDWAAGWDTYLNRLEPHLAGGFLSEEDAHEGFLERNDHYAERFGLDPELGRQFWRATHP